MKRGIDTGAFIINFWPLVRTEEGLNAMRKMVGEDYTWERCAAMVCSKSGIVRQCKRKPNSKLYGPQGATEAMYCFPHTFAYAWWNDMIGKVQERIDREERGERTGEGESDD